MTDTHTEFRVSSFHSEDLANGQMVDPGGIVRLTDQEIADPYNKRKIDAGLLVELGQVSPPEPAAPPVKEGTEEDNDNESEDDDS